MQKKISKKEIFIGVSGLFLGFATGVAVDRFIENSRPDIGPLLNRANLAIMRETHVEVDVGDPKRCFMRFADGDRTKLPQGILLKPGVDLVVEGEDDRRSVKVPSLPGDRVELRCPTSE